MNSFRLDVPFRQHSLHLVSAVVCVGGTRSALLRGGVSAQINASAFASTIDALGVSGRHMATVTAALQGASRADWLLSHQDEALSDGVVERGDIEALTCHWRPRGR